MSDVLGQRVDQSSAETFQPELVEQAMKNHVTQQFPRKTRMFCSLNGYRMDSGSGSWSRDRYNSSSGSRIKPGSRSWSTAKEGSR